MRSHCCLFGVCSLSKQHLCAVIWVWGVSPGQHSSCARTVSTGTGRSCCGNEAAKGARRGTRDCQRAEVKPQEESPELQQHKRRWNHSCSCSSGSLLPAPTGISGRTQLFQHRLTQTFGRDLKDHLKLKPPHLNQDPSIFQHFCISTALFVLPLALTYTKDTSSSKTLI